MLGLGLTEAFLIWTEGLLDAGLKCCSGLHPYGRISLTPCFTII
uniref:Uncharacterized protein n=1 Tax=Anguilla anguilla TaxID=7936 RepID=A0A0E9RLC7_ANGAN